MTVRTMDPAQVQPFALHLAQAAGLDDERRRQIAALAAQLSDVRVLPILGAGASIDCGMRLAKEIGEDFHRDYVADPAFAPHQAATPDLADVAQAIYNHVDQAAAVRALGLPDPALWPDSRGMGPHFCAYRVLARLCREYPGSFDEAFGFNYDCGKEAALTSEGFLLSARTIRGNQWPDHARVIADRESYYKPVPDGALTFIKAHGCAARYRELASTDEDKAADTIVVRKSQLTNWRRDSWAQDRLRDGIRRRVLLLIGFAGNDPVIHGEVETILQEVLTQPQATPRVVVIDWEPNTPTLQGLIKSGLGGGRPPDGTVTGVRVEGVSTTAVLLVFLTELLQQGLSPHLERGFALPADMNPLLAALTISGPLMLRWAYLLRAPTKNEFVQKINLEQAAEYGYVPLLSDPKGTVQALRLRNLLRQQLGIHGSKTTDEVLDNYGFVVRGGFAYLPTSLDLAELRAACRSGGLVARASSVLGRPPGLECVLVTEDSGALRGIHIDTAAEIGLPA